MSYTTGTTHYNLPQTVGSDKRDWTDTNEAFSDVDAALWEAHQGATQAALDIASINSEIQTITGKQADDEADIATISGKVSTLETTVANHTTEIGDVRRDLQDNIESLREDTATSTHAYSIGDYFYYNDVLFKATAPIAIGATIVPNTNCTGVTVMDELKNSGAGESAASVSYDNTSSGLVATNVQAAIDEVNQNLTKFLRYDSTSDMIQIMVGGVWTNWQRAYMQGLTLFANGQFMQGFSIGNNAVYRNDYPNSGPLAVVDGYINVPSAATGYSSGSYISPSIDFTQYSEIEVKWATSSSQTMQTFTISLTGVNTTGYIFVSNNVNALRIGYNTNDSGYTSDATHSDIVNSSQGTATEYNIESIVIR